MSRTSDYCPRCKSVQKGLRLVSGEFVCLNCSTKRKIIAAIGATAFQSPGPRGPDPRASPRVGLLALSVGLAAALLAVPICTHYHAAGSNGQGLLVIVPFATVAVFLGLFSIRHVLGAAGAVFSLVALAETLGMTLYLEAQDTERRGSAAQSVPKLGDSPGPTTASVKDPPEKPQPAVPSPKAPPAGTAVRESEVPKRAVTENVPKDKTTTDKVPTETVAADKTEPEKTEDPRKAAPRVAYPAPLDPRPAEDARPGITAAESRRQDAEGLARERQRQKTERAFEDLKQRYNLELQRNVALLESKTQELESRTTLVSLITIMTQEAEAFRKRLVELRQKPDTEGLRARFVAELADLENKMAPYQIELEGRNVRLQTLENDLVGSQNALDRMKQQIEVLTIQALAPP